MMAFAIGITIVAHCLHDYGVHSPHQSISSVSYSLHGFSASLAIAELTPVRATAGAAASSSLRGTLCGPEEASGSVESVEGSAGRTSARPAAVGGRQRSAAPPDAIAAGTECFAEQPLFVANTPTIWIARNRRDPVIRKLPPGFLQTTS